MARPKDDPRRNMSDEEILRKFVDLSKSDMTDEEMEELMELILDHRDAFSLRDEIGECPNITIDIDVIDDSPFFVRTSSLSQSVKKINQSWMSQAFPNQSRSNNGLANAETSFPGNPFQEYHKPYKPCHVDHKENRC